MDDRERSWGSIVVSSEVGKEVLFLVGSAEAFPAQAKTQCQMGKYFVVIVDVGSQITGPEVERGKSCTSLGCRDMAQEEVLEAKQGRIAGLKSIGFCVRESNVTALGKVVKAVQLVLAAFKANPNQMLAFGNRKVVALVECVEMAPRSSLTPVPIWKAPPPDTCNR